MRLFSDPPRPVPQRIFYETCKWFCFFSVKVFFRLRIFGKENYPKDGGMLICSNHQSNLDPVMIGVSCPRHTNYLGKKSLFKHPPLRWILPWLDTIPIDREATGIAGMKETLRRLKREESVVLFPEGQRSEDGELMPLMTGFIALARRINSPLLPVGIAGAYEAWPRRRKLPRPGKVVVVFGEPIPQSDLAGLNDEEIANLLHARITECYDLARSKR